MVYIPLIYFILLALHYYRKQHRWSAELAAISVLIAICLAAVAIDTKDLYGMYGCNENNLSLFGVTIFCLEWTILFKAFHIVTDKMIVSPRNGRENKLYKHLIACIFLCVLIRVLYMGGDIIHALTSDALDVKTQHYEELEMGSTTTGRNVFMYLPLLFSAVPYPTLALVWFFYGLATGSNSQVQNIMLLFVSLSQVALATLLAGRAAIVYWLVEFYILTCLFWKDLSPRLHKLIVCTSTVFGGAIIVLFAIVTISRFSSSSPLDSIIGYMGQPLNNFCTFISKGGTAPTQIGRIFPLTYKLSGHHFMLMEHYQNIEDTCDFHANVFGTFGGVVYLDLGVVALIILLLLMWYIVHFPLQRMKALTLSNTIWLTITIAFFSRGLFGWPFVGHYTIWGLISIICIFFLLNYNFNFKK